MFPQAMYTLSLWLRNAAIEPLPPPATPIHCPPHCQHSQPYRWGARTRTVQDLQGACAVLVQRDRCRACQRMWSVTPDGVDRTRRTQCLQQWHGCL